MNQTNYSYYKKVEGAFNIVLKKVKEKMKEGGFGILTEIDVQKTLKEKLNIDRKPYIILGICKPKYAHQAMQAEDQIGLFLPCKAIVYEKNDDVWVSVIKPEKAMEIVKNDTLRNLSVQVEKELKLIIEKI